MTQASSGPLSDGTASAAAALGTEPGPGAEAGPGTGGSATAPASVRDRVELSVPADPAYLAVLRTATAGLAARADMTIDEIEDLRIAVDEACALVLGDGALLEGTPTPPPVLEPPLTIDAVFELGHQGMVVRVSGPSSRLPERSSFAWSVLEALVDALDAGTDEGGRRSIILRHGSRRPA